MSSEKTLYLIDGTAFAHRSFHAIRTQLTDEDGNPTNAVFGFTKTLMKLLREETPGYIAVVFDSGKPTFRHAEYPEYKAQRPKTPDELIAQFGVIEEVVEAFGIPRVIVEGCEADDVLGTLAKRATESGFRTVIVTSDKDAFQLVSPEVTVYNPNKANGRYGPAEVEEHFGVPPEHVTDVLGLWGDSTDNIPGVRGIGEKGSKQLVSEFGTLEQIYSHLDQVKDSLRKKLEAEHEQAILSRRLATIKRDVPVEIEPDSCELKEFDRERIAELFRRLRFASLMEDFLPQTQEKLDYRIVSSVEELSELVERLRGHGSFCIDVETTSVDPMRAELVGISLCSEPMVAFYVPVGHTEESLAPLGDARSGLPSREEVLGLLGPLLADESVRKTGQNIKYDMVVLARNGLDLRGIDFDTMVASYLIDPSHRRHNLTDLSAELLDRKMIPISDLIGTGSKQLSMADVDVNRVAEYSCEDADVTWRVRSKLEPLLEERGVKRLFDDVEVPLISVLAKIEMAGVAIDPALFESLAERLNNEIGRVTAEVYELAGEKFNINSPKQLQTILFDKLKLPRRRRTKTGYSTDMAVLEDLALEHPLPEKLVEYRSLEKLRGTYVEALPKLVNPETGRLHTSFNQTVTATGRLSSSDPNLQNIPIRTELGREIRAGFVAGSPENQLLSADYSQIELRVLAHLSGDEALVGAFKAGADIHTDTAARIFGVQPSQVTPEMRRRAKVVNFGILYGMGAFRLAREFGIAHKEAAKFIDHYFSVFAEVKEYLDGVVKGVEERGYAETILKRRRYIPELRTSRGQARRRAERMALNMPIQGSAADLIKLAMVKLDAALTERRMAARMILQVHDELLLEVPNEEVETTGVVVRETMENVYKLAVPLKVETGWGRNWYECH
jgi:DNA polymerase-1